MKKSAVKAVLVACLRATEPLACARRTVHALALHASRGVPAAENEVLLRESLAKALGVQSRMLEPVAAAIREAAERGDALTPQGFLQLIEDAAERLPELFSPSLAMELARGLEAAMGTAALNGVRETLRNTA